MATRGGRRETSLESLDSDAREALADGGESNIQGCDEREIIIPEAELPDSAAAQDQWFLVTKAFAWTDGKRDSFVNFLKDAKSGSGLRICGIFHADDDSLDRLVEHRGQDPRHKNDCSILLKDIYEYAIGFEPSHAVVIWVYTPYGCYEVRPSEEYLPIMDEITLAVSILYEFEDHYQLHPYRRDWQLNKSMSDEVANVLTMHNGEENGAGMTIEQLLDACRELRKILMDQFEQKQKDFKSVNPEMKIRWTATYFYQWLKSGCLALDPPNITAGLAASVEMAFPVAQAITAGPITTEPSRPVSSTKELRPFHGIYKSIQFPNGPRGIPADVVNLREYITEHIAAIILHGIQTGRLKLKGLTQKTVGRVLYKDYSLALLNLGTMFVYENGPEIYQYLSADLQQSKFGKSLIALPRPKISETIVDYVAVGQLYKEFFPEEPGQAAKVFARRTALENERGVKVAEKPVKKLTKENANKDTKKSTPAPASTLQKPKRAPGLSRKLPVPDTPIPTVATPAAVPTPIRPRLGFDPAIMSPSAQQFNFLNMPLHRQSASLVQHLINDGHPMAGLDNMDVDMAGASDFRISHGHEDTYMGGPAELDEDPDSLFVGQRYEDPHPQLYPYSYGS